jgi:hypothetical protein
MKRTVISRRGWRMPWIRRHVAAAGLPITAPV